jgi:hypothetical protein
MGEANLNETLNPATAREIKIVIPGQAFGPARRAGWGTSKQKRQ